MQTFLIRLSLAFLLPMAIGCQSSDNFVESDVPRVSILEEHIRPFDQVVSEVKFISLRPPENTPINLACNNSKLIITDKIYYCTMCYQRSAVHVFDLEGNYINGLTKQGEGPEEYQVIQGIHVGSDVLSLSSGNGQIKQYTLPDFYFENEFSLGETFFLSSFHPISASSWLISAEYTGEMDEDGQFPVYMRVDQETGTSTHLPVKAYPAAAESGEGQIALFDDQFLLNFGFSDTLFVYDGEKLGPYNILDFGSRHPTLDVLTAMDEEFGEIIQSQSIAINLGMIDYTEQTIQLKTFGLKKNPQLDLEDRTTFPFHNVFIGPEQQVVAFPVLGSGLNSKGYAKDGYFYEVLQPEDWMDALETNLLGRYW
jgi:hypothetical protein